MIYSVILEFDRTGVIITAMVGDNLIVSPGGWRASPGLEGTSH